MAQVGTGKYTYELIRDFCKLPEGQTFGLVSRVAADAQDRVYVFQRKNPPVVVFDRDGKYLGAWGSGAVTDLVIGAGQVSARISPGRMPVQENHSTKSRTSASVR